MGNLSNFQTILWPETKVSNVGFYKKPSAGFPAGSVIEAPFTRSGAGRKVIDASGNLVDAAANLPAWTFPIGGSSAGCPYLSFLPSVENLATYSEDLSNAAYTTVGLAAPTSAGTLNGLDAWYIEGDGAASSHRIFQSFTASATTTYSVYAIVEADTNEHLQIAISGATPFGLTNYINFNLAEGYVGASNNQTGDIVSLGNGIYFVWTSLTSGGTGGAAQFDLALISGDSAARLESWTTSGRVKATAVMLKEGSYISPLDYVPTTNLALTRNFDAITNFSLVPNGFISSDSSYTAFLQINQNSIPTSAAASFRHTDSGSLKWAVYTATSEENFVIRDYVNSANGGIYANNEGFSKVVVIANSSEIKIYINGFLVYTASGDFSGDDLTTMNSTAGAVYNLKQWAYSNLELTPTEAIAASSWETIAEMAADLNYTID